jgi:hypothetical protein
MIAFATAEPAQANGSAVVQVSVSTRLHRLSRVVGAEG